MTTTIAHLSISLDGFVAGPEQSLEQPIGVGGLRLHQWHFDADEPGHEASVPMRDELLERGDAYVMGRNMFGPIRGEWDESWRGWWGEEPPCHAPVFVLTHYPRASIEMAGGTTFHFVTEGLAVALQRAAEVAGDGVVDIAGGASTVRQALAAGRLDELVLDLTPVLLGEGERLFDGLTDPVLEPVEVVATPWATHLRYRVG